MSFSDEIEYVFVCLFMYIFFCFIKGFKVVYRDVWNLVRWYKLEVGEKEKNIKVRVKL